MAATSSLDAAKLYPTPPSSPWLRPISLAPDNMLGLWLPEPDVTGTSNGPPELPFGPLCRWDGELELQPLSRRIDLGPPSQNVVQPPPVVHAPATTMTAATGSLGLATQSSSNNLPQPITNATTGEAGSLDCNVDN